MYSMDGSQMTLVSESSSASSSCSASMASNHSRSSASSASTASSSSCSSNSNSTSHKRVRFDERCRVRPIKKLCYMEQEVRARMWYNREELKNMRKDCRDLIREALHQLQKAQVKQKKKEAQEKLQEMGQESHPCSSRKLADPLKKNKAKQLFRPSAFRGLEMFHPKMSIKREGRRQEQWEAILTEQAKQQMKRSHEEMSDNESSSSENESTTTSKEDDSNKKKKRLPKEQDLLVLAKLSLGMTEIASKEAHKRALRDQQDLLHPPKYWMLPWLREDGTPKTPSKKKVKKSKDKPKDAPILPMAPPVTVASPSIKKKRDMATALSKLELETESPRRAKLRELLSLKQDQPRPVTPSLGSSEPKGVRAA